MNARRPHSSPLLRLALLALLAACATNPATGRREISLMSEAQEISIGMEQDAVVRREMGVYADAALQQYVSTIGLEMAKLSERPNLPWKFTVVDSPAINAFALPGGFIYITRGILPFLGSDAELAGVLGHEIGHVTARHSAQQYTRAVGGTAGLVVLGIFVPQAQPGLSAAQQALGVLFLRYGREDELEADQLGVRYASRAAWDPAGVPGMLSTLGRLDEASGETRGVPNWLSTHPEPLARVAAIQPVVTQVRAGRADWRRDPAAILQRVDGLLYGDNPEQGVVRGSAFLHPVLKLRVDFPSQWQVDNSPTQVVAKAPDADLFMLLQDVAEPQGSTVGAIAVNHMRQAGMEPVAGDAATLNGLDAFVGVYRGQLQDLGPVTMRAAHIRLGSTVYLLGGLAPPQAFPAADAAFQAAIRSFRELSAAEAADIHPNRIDLTVVRQGDTWESLAARSRGAIKASTLAVMNDATPASTPPPGSRVKIVVSD